MNAAIVRIRSCLLTLLAALASGCGREPAAPPPRLDLVFDSVSLALGSSRRVDMVLLYAPAATPVSFSSSDAGTVRVDATGTMTAVAPGAAMIQAVADGFPAARDSMLVHVFIATMPCCEERGPYLVIDSLSDAAGRPVDPAHVRGTVTVTASVTVPETLDANAVIILDGVGLATSPPAPPGTSQRFRATIRSDARDAAGQRVYATGIHLLTISLVRTGGAVIATSSQVLGFED
ncbi:MAG TPA: Ig-like domain-containing protein [Longimicrobiales bacterium]|nr:Ig-like domain-containing protein [Longimicrobiales bacterium]